LSTTADKEPTRYRLYTLRDVLSSPADPHGLAERVTARNVDWAGSARRLAGVLRIVIEGHAGRAAPG
jgi:hypothetical protein